MTLGTTEIRLRQHDIPALRAERPHCASSCCKHPATRSPAYGRTTGDHKRRIHPALLDHATPINTAQQHIDITGDMPTKPELDTAGTGRTTGGYTTSSMPSPVTVASVVMAADRTPAELVPA